MNNFELTFAYNSYQYHLLILKLIDSSPITFSLKIPQIILLINSLKILSSVTHLNFLLGILFFQKITLFIKLMIIHMSYFWIHPIIHSKHLTCIIIVERTSLVVWKIFYFLFFRYNVKSISKIFVWLFLI